MRTDEVEEKDKHRDKIVCGLQVRRNHCTKGLGGSQLSFNFTICLKHKGGKNMLQLVLTILIYMIMVIPVSTILRLENIHLLTL